MAYSTDFFSHQERARKSTALLIIYFILAVILIDIAIYGVITHGLSIAEIPLNLAYGFFDPVVFFLVSLIVISVIVGATLNQLSKYRQGGGALVAESLEGKRIDPATKEPKERLLLNIVEEMALASGVPVPAVFVIPEDGINAFAAGFTIDDAVVAVTTGSLEVLSRDELQGVIAHEFSHILNGDMKLNLRLTSVLYGLYVLAIVGFTLFRIIGMGKSRSGSSSSRSSKKEGGGGAIIVIVLSIAIAFMVLGFLGQLIGKFIQRAISRQKEFLADASAVQFTRNPQGIASALKKIGGYVDSSNIASEHANELGHMFFADGLRKKMFSLLSTHPDLATRIKRIDPSFNGTFPEVLATPVPKITLNNKASTISAASEMFLDVDVPVAGTLAIDKATVMNTAGTLNSEHVAYAANLVQSILPELVSASRDAYTARSVIFLLLVDNDPTVRYRQLEMLSSKLSSHELSETSRLLSFKGQILPQHRLVLLELSLPVLGQMSSSQYQDFISIVHLLVEADKKIDAFEFVVRQFVKRQYDRVCRKSVSQSNVSSAKILPEIVVLLSVLARQGIADNEAGAANAFRKGINSFELTAGLSPSSSNILPQDSEMFPALDKAFDILSTVPYKQKNAIMGACVQCVLSDELVTIEEFELLRAIGEMMGVPIPPYVEVN